MTSFSAGPGASGGLSAGSGLSSLGDLRLDEAYQTWNRVASYDDYGGAQAAVDRLSDAGFPVEHLDIVGSDLRLVERVTGRLTTGRAALAGAASGAWFGLFIGLLLGFFTTSGWVAILVSAILIGAVWGLVFGALGHAATRGQRDFASVRALAATRYDVIARNGMAEQARKQLTDLDGGASVAPSTETGRRG
jgi:hypothetical protein